MPTIAPYIGIIRREQVIYGSGFVVHPSGLVVTCNHVLHALDTQPIGERVTFHLLVQNLQLDAIVTKHIDPIHDVGLLQLVGSIPKNFEVATLLSSSDISVGHHFSLTGFGLLADPSGRRYDYMSAEGQIVGAMRVDDANLMQLRSENLLEGMSGAPVIPSGLNGVCGVLSGRFSIDPRTGTWMEHMGYATRSEAIVDLSPLLTLQFPTTAENSQIVQIENNAQEIYRDNARKIIANNYYENNNSS